jgi:hypothetical protein
MERHGRATWQVVASDLRRAPTSCSTNSTASWRTVRYADDIYVRSERAGQRVMESISRFITQKLKLKVNEAKSAA